MVTRAGHDDRNLIAPVQVVQRKLHELYAQSAPELSSPPTAALLSGLFPAAIRMASASRVADE